MYGGMRFAKDGPPLTQGCAEGTLIPGFKVHALGIYVQAKTAMPGVLASIMETPCTSPLTPNLKGDQGGEGARQPSRAGVHIGLYTPSQLMCFLTSARNQKGISLKSLRLQLPLCNIAHWRL
jgi:hypothetical protein